MVGHRYQLERFYEPKLFNEDNHVSNCHLPGIEVLRVVAVSINASKTSTEVNLIEHRLNCQKNTTLNYILYYAKLL